MGDLPGTLETAATQPITLPKEPLNPTGQETPGTTFNTDIKPEEPQVSTETKMSDVASSIEPANPPASALSETHTKSLGDLKPDIPSEPKAAEPTGGSLSAEGNFTENKKSEEPESPVPDLGAMSAASFGTPAKIPQSEDSTGFPTATAEVSSLPTSAELDASPATLDLGDKNQIAETIDAEKIGAAPETTDVRNALDIAQENGGSAPGIGLTEPIVETPAPISGVSGVESLVTPVSGLATPEAVVAETAPVAGTSTTEPTVTAEPPKSGHWWERLFGGNK